MALTAKKVYAILKRQISDMEAKLNSPVRYRGTVATADLLPLNPDIGDMYNIESKSVYGEAGMNVAWNGVVWDTMGAPIDMSLYFTKEEAEAVIQRLVTEYFEKNPVKPGATTEQAQQIEQNKEDITSLKAETSSLKEDIGDLSSSKISKFYATNNGENHLADSDDGKIADMMVYGKSEQKSTTGAQLFDMSTAFAGWVGDDGTPRNDGAIGKADNIVSDYIPVESNTVYSCNNNNNIFVWEYDSSKTLIKSDGQLNSESFTTSEIAKYIVFAVSYSSAQTPDYIKTIMFNKGSSVLPWEPYTGGQPSPSPDYPQEIKSVVNPTIKICGKNLFDSKKFPIILKMGLDTNTGNIYETTSGKYCATEKYIPFPYGGKKNSFNASMSLCAYDKDYKFISSINKNNRQIPLGTIYVRFDIKIEDKDKAQIELSENATPYEPYHEQTATLPYTLNAIPVSSGGNVTIDGQQYVADYVDVERGKLVRMVGVTDQDAFETSKWESAGSIIIFSQISNVGAGDAIVTISSKYAADWSAGDEIHHFTQPTGQSLVMVLPKTITTVEQGEEIRAKGFKFYYILATPIETDLTTEEITAFKALVTYYPTTNISISSEQLDGYTVFNYPISMANGWNYVKQQLNDNRDYIYDMDTKTQDIDTQAAEAYVNSEYAVALTELEV